MYRMLLLLPWLYACLLFAGSATAHNDAPEQVYDGPYVFNQGSIWQALWVCGGQAKQLRFKAPTRPQWLSNCGMGAQLRAEPANRPPINYPLPAKLAAISDIHGQFPVFTQLLMAHGIIDVSGNWQFGHGQLVISGDVFDRGPTQTEALWFIYRLQQQAQTAGGKLHLLLGNHEVMVLNGDYRYLHDKYRHTADILGYPLARLYAEDTVLGQWLRSSNVLVKIGNLLFVHGGLHPDLAKEQHSLEEINQVFTQNLMKDKRNKRRGFARYLHKKHGPIWYRGYFKSPLASEAEIDLLRQHFGIDTLIVGHTTQPHILSRYHGKVIAIDSGIKGGETGEILLYENQRFYRGLLDGSTVPLSSEVALSD
ncbi:metallophosphoesterase [Shewanella sp. YIC-542]|uniref:metallophosphoesterase n=1 Tax=Shewanella mytili TaxID=3377111 RepID=UPI00398E412C